MLVFGGVVVSVDHRISPSLRAMEFGHLEETPVLEAHPPSKGLQDDTGIHGGKGFLAHCCWSATKAASPVEQ